MSSNKIRFGFLDEWETFLNRHPKLTEKLSPLFQTLHKTFIREVQASKPADRVVFFLGRLCVEDFVEILLLCGNGYGIGGMKLLRGLFERAVTLGYIAKAPDKADDFLEYHHVHLGKHFNHAKQAFPMTEILSPEEIQEIQERYKKAKEKYQAVICKKCGTTRTRFSWSELDLVSMARNAGLERLYLKCYYEPTLQAHATVSSLITRMRIRDNGGVAFDEGVQHEKADTVLIGAHNIILYILNTENEYFGMGLQEEIQERFEDFMSIWKNKEIEDQSFQKNIRQCEK